MMVQEITHAQSYLSKLLGLHVSLLVYDGQGIICPDNVNSGEKGD